MATETRHAWVLVTRSEVPEQWLAHCLDLDIMSQGNSIEHALGSLREAMLICFADDEERGFNPLERDEAPEECWAPFWLVMKKHVPLDAVPESRRSEICAVVAKLRISVIERHDEVELEPPAWQLAAMNRLQQQGSAPSRPC